MAQLALRSSLGSAACLAVLLAATVSWAHHCPRGSYWGRNSTYVACGHHKFCTKYGPWHCIQKQAPPK